MMLEWLEQISWRGDRPMAGRRAWDLEVERAEHHLDEVEARMAAHADGNAFRATRVDGDPGLLRTRIIQTWSGGSTPRLTRLRCGPGACTESGVQAARATSRNMSDSTFHLAALL